MKTRCCNRLARTALALASGAALPLALAAERGTDAALQHDVFRRPNLNAAVPQQPAQPQAEEWLPNLRAIVMAGERSLVLVERSVVEIGGAVDGYRLVGVTESTAIFARGGRRFELVLARGKAQAR